MKQFWLIYLSIASALCVCLATGLIAGWGTWYSPSLPYRMQTEAMLHGRFRLSDSPADAQFDLVWAKGGVQQVWGLGVPCWRLPFELLARIFGRPSFPDRLALLMAMILVNYCLLVAFTNAVPAADRPRLSDELTRIAVPLFVILFPPILSLFQSNFHVYEESVAYSYLLGVGLFSGLLLFCQRPSLSRYFILCLLSGLSGFFRPTILAYGLATVAIAFYYSQLKQWSFRKSLTGLIIFATGTALLLWTNAVRFGSPFEFGYGLQLNGMYELRFGGPYAQEPFWPAARELIGAIFFTEPHTQISKADVYGPGVVFWQSSTPRWRYFYHATFDGAYLIAIIFCWSGAILHYLRNRRTGSPPNRLQSLTAAWSFLGMLPLALFYLHYPAISSRYMLDFGPAIAAATASTLWMLYGSTVGKRTLYRTTTVACAICLWWFYELPHGNRQIVPDIRALSGQALANRIVRSSRISPLPNEYKAESFPDRHGIPENESGWRNAHGETDALVTLFFKDPKKICVTVTTDVRPYPGQKEFETIRAKIGNEALRLESSQNFGENTKLTFSAPRSDLHRFGIQVLFIAMAAEDNYLDNATRFRLLSVRSEP